MGTQAKAAALVSYQIEIHTVSVRLGEGQTSFEVLLQELAPLCKQTFLPLRQPVCSFVQRSAGASIHQGCYGRALLLSYMPLGQFQVDQRERTQVIVRPKTVSCPFLHGSGKIQRQTLP